MIDFTKMSTWQRQAIKRRADYVHSIRPTEARHDLPCPLCGTFMRLLDSMFGRVYMCPARGCKGKRGARPDGSPTGTPFFRASPELTEARRLIWGLRERLRETCLRMRRNPSEFNEAFESRWGRKANKPDQCDLDTCQKMIRHLEWLLKRAGRSRYTHILDDALGDASIG